MEQQYEIDAQDVIEILTEQRNSALNELARMQALVRKLTKQQPGNSHADPSGFSPQLVRPN